jgi:GTP-binding protein HflX
LSDTPNRSGPYLTEDRLGHRARVYGSEKAVLVGVDTDQEGTHAPLRELERLADTAGIPTLARFVQKRSHPHPATFIGKGKVVEINRLANDLEADVIIFNDELSPAQARNLEEKMGKKVIDRTQLIMDIFAQRAATKEAKLQVELAQLRYLLPRLRGWGGALTRLGGGIGTRGPGETQLELDRKKITHRIHAIERHLKKTRAERTLQRQRRSLSPLHKIALVGYTNSGKSTLLNSLCLTDAFVEDKLFATLTTTVRRGKLTSGRWALFADTVGFIRALPHHLIPAFAATLEVVRDADLILHVIDLNSETLESDYTAVLETLEHEVFDGHNTRPPILNVLNKIDLYNGEEIAAPIHGVRISAKFGTDLDELLQRVDELLEEGYVTRRLLIPYAAYHLLFHLSKPAIGSSQQHTEKGVVIDITLSLEEFNRLKKAGATPIPSSSPSFPQEGPSPA